MQLKKIASNLRLLYTGAAAEVPLTPFQGGARNKVVQFMVAVRSANGAPTLGCKIDHGPDGIVHATHTTLANAALPTTNIYVFDSDSTKILGDWIHPILTVGGAVAGDAMTVDVYAVLKPF